METIGNISFSVAKDHCHLELLNIFSKLARDTGLRLFGITTDIDNLGVYVARFGRAAAQNLVDFYITILSEYIYSAQRIVRTEDIFYLPAGEEATILGLVSNPNDASLFSSNLSVFLKSKMTTCPFDLGATAISLGSKYFDSEDLYYKIFSFINSPKQRNPEMPSHEYYDILYVIRNAISPIVDRAKFAEYAVSNDNDLVFIRNYIYSELLSYKLSIHKLLPLFVQFMRKRSRDADLAASYGLTDEQHRKFQMIKNELILRNDEHV